MSAGTAVDPRLCDYCDRPALGMMVRVIRGDPASKRVAIGAEHQACRAAFHLDVERHGEVDGQDAP